MARFENDGIGNGHLVTCSNIAKSRYRCRVQDRCNVAKSRSRFRVQARCNVAQIPVFSSRKPKGKQDPSPQLPPEM